MTNTADSVIYTPRCTCKKKPESTQLIYFMCCLKPSQMIAAENI